MGVVHPAQHDGDRVELQRVVRLLRYVVLADRVFKTYVKPEAPILQ